MEGGKTMHVKHLNLDHIKSYADACRKLHDYIEVLRAEDHDLLVVPSRGAHPFLSGANSYAHKLRADNCQLFSARLLLPIEELYLPFTADIGADVPVKSSEVRRYWSRTLAAIIRRDTDDVAYRLYEYLRATAGGLAIGSTSVRGGKSGKFIFVDTVQSGQAICEIFSAFEQYGLNDCHFILLVDECGQRLKPEYAKIIDQMERSKRLTIIHVEKIFTEDEGPAMSGIWTVTFPDIMASAMKIIPELYEAKETAASFYYHEVSQRPDGSNRNFTVSNARLAVMLHSAIHENDAVTKQFLDDFKRHIDESKLQDQEITRKVAYPVIARYLPVVSTDISGSHVIRANFAPGQAERMIADFLKKQIHACSI